MEEFQARTIVEPFKIKVVEPLAPLSRSDRWKALQTAQFNLFKLNSQDVFVDMLTDSGTSAMSSEQWAQIQRGDESYAGSVSFLELMREVKDLTGFDAVIPTHQGRAAERILFECLTSRKKGTATHFIPNNSHFDTTRANLEAQGFVGLDFPCREFFDFKSTFPFKGNMDLERLDVFLRDTLPGQVPVGFMTITNNSCGGQPASLENIQAVAKLYQSKKIPFFLDACRFAENVAFIQRYEKPNQSPKAIAKEIFSLADGFTFSAKKDALVNIGGLLATRDAELFEDMRSRLILTEGFPTYGGLAGRDLAAMAQGLREVVEPAYLEYRLAVTAYMAKRLDEMGVPILRPAGGHAIYLDAKSFCDHLESSDYPGHGLALALYLEGGLRACEIGSLMFGRQPDGSEKAHGVELVRLAIPRRVYTQSHMDYVLELVEFVWKHRRRIGKVRFVKEAAQLRHFNSEFSWSMIGPNDTF